MDKRELIVKEIERLSEADLNRLFVFMHALSEEHAEAPVPTSAAESSLASDWAVPGGGCRLGQPVSGDRGRPALPRNARI